MPSGRLRGVVPTVLVAPELRGEERTTNTRPRRREIPKLTGGGSRPPGRSGGAASKVRGRRVRRRPGRSFSRREESARVEFARDVHWLARSRGRRARYCYSRRRGEPLRLRPRLRLTTCRPICLSDSLLYIAVFRFLRYGPGDYFRPHRDSHFVPEVMDERHGRVTSFQSLLLYLDAPDVGGADRCLFCSRGPMDTASPS